MIPRVIPLQNPSTAAIYDRTRGETFDITVKGGIFFHSIPTVGLRISLDGERTSLPVRVGRVYYAKASRLTFYHAPETDPAMRLTGFEIVTFDVGEDVADVASATAALSASGSSALVQPNVLVSWSLQFPTGSTRTHHIFANLVGSGHNYVCEALETVQGSIASSTDDDFMVGTLAELQSAAIPINSANSKVAQSVGYSDTAKMGGVPPFEYWLAQPAALGAGVAALIGDGRLWRGREAAANTWIEQASVRGMRITPGNFFAWCPNSGSSTSFRARFSEV